MRLLSKTSSTSSFVCQASSSSLSYGTVVVVVVISLCASLPVRRIHGYHPQPTIIRHTNPFQFIQATKPSSVWFKPRYTTTTTSPYASSSREEEPSTTTATTLSVRIDKDTLLSELDTCTSGTVARSLLSRVLLLNTDSNNSNKSPLYNSLSIPPLASMKYLSDADLAIQTNIRNQRKSVVELIDTNGDADADRASLFLFGLFVSSTVSSIVVDVNFIGPEILKFVLVWLLSFAPLLFVGAGLAVPQQLQRQLISLQSVLFPSYRKRMVQHEAGHFLMGHLLGLPVKQYQINAIQNAVEFYPLKDDTVGDQRAKTLGFDRKKNENDRDDLYSTTTTTTTSSSRPFFSEGGRADDLLQKSVLADPAKLQQQQQQLPMKDRAQDAWPYRKLDENTLDILSVVSLAGVCSEILGFGNAQGGYADLSQLSAILSDNLEEEDDLDLDSQLSNRIRFAIGYNFGQLRRHLGALDALAEIMERGGTVQECVLAIENCDNVAGSDCDSNVLLLQGNSNSNSNYERQRRERLQSEWNILERIFLDASGGNGERNDVIEGKGGGDARPKFALTGDDALYAAVAAALAFFVWASNGGLSLH